MWSGTDRSNKLSVLDSDDGSVSPDSTQDIWGIDYKIKSISIVWCLHNTQLHTLNV